MNSEQPLKTNMMDVLLYLLKGAMISRNGAPLRITSSDISRVENCDLKMSRGLDGTIVVTLIEGQDPRDSKIILPTGQSPLTIL